MDHCFRHSWMDSWNPATAGTEGKHDTNRWAKTASLHSTDGEAVRPHHYKGHRGASDVQTRYRVTFPCGHRGGWDGFQEYTDYEPSTWSAWGHTKSDLRTIRENHEHSGRDIGQILQIRCDQRSSSSDHEFDTTHSVSFDCSREQGAYLVRWSASHILWLRRHGPFIPGMPQEAEKNDAIQRRPHIHIRNCCSYHPFHNPGSQEGRSRGNTANWQGGC